MTPPFRAGSLAALRGLWVLRRNQAIRLRSPHSKTDCPQPATDPEELDQAPSAELRAEAFEVNAMDLRGRLLDRLAGHVDRGPSAVAAHEVACPA